MNWRVANSLLTLRTQVNELAPQRSKSDDGTIGDASHQARTSDHNPWIKDGDTRVVSAMDLTHDPHGGFDSYAFAESLREKRNDPRIKYVISNRRIWSPSISPNWRAYNGSNPHDRHVHVSVSSEKKLYDDTRQWSFILPKPDLTATPREQREVLRFGSQGDQVGYLQTLLGLAVDRQFGRTTDAAVRLFQKTHGLEVDGVVGSRTWEMLITDKHPDQIAVAPVEPEDVYPDSGKGSWYSQYRGKYVWRDTGDEPGSAALGVPDNQQGVSFYNSKTLGKWFEVRAPNGVKSIEQQTDIGPHPRTGRKIDISAAAAERFGYSPSNFPTNGRFYWRRIDPPIAVASASSAKEQARLYHDLRARPIA